MQKINKFEINRYLRSQKKKLSFIYTQDEIDDILHRLNEYIYDFIQNNPSASMDELEKHLNAADELIQTKLENKSAISIKSQVISTNRIKKKFKIISIVLFLTLVIFMIFYTSEIIYVKNTTPAYVIEEIQEFETNKSIDESKWFCN